MKLSEVFQKKGQKIEENYPLTIKTAEIFTALAIVSYPFSASLSAGMIGAPMVFSALSGGLQRAGRLMARFDL